MHAVENKGHYEKVAVFEAYDVPLILRGGFVGVDIGEQAEGKDYDPEVDPDTGHHDVHYFDVILGHVLGLHEGSAKGYENITGIMHDKDHRPRSDLIAHHREEYKRGCNTMMQQQLIKLPLCLPLDDDHLKHRKEVHSKLNHEVHLEIGSIRWPIRVLFIDLAAFTTTTNNIREPIFIPKQVVGEDRSEGVKHRIEAKLQY